MPWWGWLLLIGGVVFGWVWSLLVIASRSDDVRDELWLAENDPRRSWRRI